MPHIPAADTRSAPAGSTTPAFASKAGRSPFPWLILFALVALAFNLRSPLTALPPVVGAVRADLGIGATVAGMLTSIPVLCFGLLTPLASLLIARTGIGVAIFITLGGAAIGLVLRAYSDVSGMVGGTFLVGASLSIGNILSLMVIARDFPERRNMVTGLYTASLNLGTMLTGAVTAPLATLTGWRFALASWAWMALLAVGLWVWAGRATATRQAPAAPSPSGEAIRSAAPPPPLTKRPIVWQLSVAFAIHLFIYYAITAWLPAYLIETDHLSPTQAGLVASAFQVISLIGAFGAPLLSRLVPLGPQLAAMGVLWLITPLWMLVAPGQWLGWSVTGGIAQGGTFVVVFMLIMRHATSLDDNRRLSMIVQGFGYSLAALGPITMGWLHEMWGSWTGIYLALAALSLGLVATGIAVGRAATR